MKYFELNIKKTSKPYGHTTPQNDWNMFDKVVKEFETLEEVKKYLSDEYFYAKTTYPIYKDGENGEAVQVGKIYAFKAGWGDDKWYEQHWIEVKEVTRKDKIVIV